MIIYPAIRAQSRCNLHSPRRHSGSDRGAAGDAEVEAKYRALNDPVKFWAYVAATTPVYAYKTCVEFDRRACRERDQG
jgi:hypothetical protein